MAIKMIKKTEKEKAAIDEGSTTRMKRFLKKPEQTEEAPTEVPFPTAEEAGEDAPGDGAAPEEEFEFDMEGILPVKESPIDLSGFGDMLTLKFNETLNLKVAEIVKAVDNQTMSMIEYLKPIKEYIFSLNEVKAKPSTETSTITKAKKVVDTQATNGNDSLSRRVLAFLMKRKEVFDKNNMADNGATPDEIIKAIKEENVTGATIESKRAAIGNALNSIQQVTKLGRGRYSV
jgi:hypothetical protein